MKDINILLNNGVNLNKSLELFGDQETYDETLEEFLNGVNEKIKLIKEFKEKSDMANYAILAVLELEGEDNGQIDTRNPLEGTGETEK